MDFGYLNYIYTILKNYEKNIDNNVKKLKGVVYTPHFIVDYINRKVILENQNEDIKVIDPACGSGAFLIDALFKLKEKTGKSFKKLVEDNIYGIDIDPFAVEKTKRLLSLIVYKFEKKYQKKFNIFCGNSLDKKFLKKVIRNTKFEAVVGNPPYVRIQNLDEESKNIIKNWSFVVGDSDLYIPFFELGINLMSNTGKMGYITPNSYFVSHSGKILRKYLQERKLIDEIVDFGHYQLFENITTYSAITILSKQNKDYFIFKKVNNKMDIYNLKNLKGIKIYFNELNYNKWILVDKRERDIIKIIESMEYKLKDIADIKVGIATLADKVYILDNPIDKGDYYIKEFNDNKFLIEKDITKEIIKVSKLKSEEDIENNKRRIIFPYKKVNGKFVIINENELKENYPNTYEYFQYTKDILLNRDKGKKNYETWYAYGRKQGINGFGKKILTPPMSLKPNFIICNKEDTLFYSGYGIFPKKEPFNDLIILKKILNSDLMRTYIEKTSKTYRDGWKSYSKTFIQNFGIPKLSKKDIEFLKKEDNIEKINSYLWRLYYEQYKKLPL